MKQIRFDNSGGNVRKTGSTGASSKSFDSKKAQASKNVNVKLPPLSDDMLRTINSLMKDPNTRENVKMILKNVGWSEEQISSFIKQQSSRKSQGANDSRARELGGYRTIVDNTGLSAPKKKPKAELPQNADVRLKSKLIAMRTGKTNLDDLRVAYRIGGAGASEADFKAFCKRNAIDYTPPKDIKWLDK